ncbi:MAG TPA: TAXI family TRAP transporter solute-binding subunit [Candidatus Methylomirabilis sp.]|nr:TAXI family TRAP transporter solute-binding subunit [Candidatus Methylomirabilis sp.]
MRRRLQSIALSMATLIFIPLTAFGEMPRSASLATAAVASIYYPMGTGIATVIGRHSPMTIRVQPFVGASAWLPSMDAGEMNMGIITSGDAVLAYRGIIIYKRAFKGLRILTIGGTLNLGFYVTKDAEMTSVDDLRGKKIPTDFPENLMVKLSSTAALASAGITYNDIIQVPVSNLQTGVQAFLEGRTDAGWHSVGSPAVEEVNARKGGIKFISVIGTPEAARRMAEIYPGSYPSVLKAGSATGIVKDTAVQTNDVYLAASKEFGEEAAYEVVKALWEYNQELGASTPALKEWRRDRMVSEKAFIPYHPGAIKFFKEKGVWNKEMEALQAKLMGQ